MYAVLDYILILNIAGTDKFDRVGENQKKW